MDRQAQTLDPSPIRNQTALCGYTIDLGIRRLAVGHMAILSGVREGIPNSSVHGQSILSEFGSSAIAFAILGALPKFKSKVGSPLQFSRALEMSKEY